MSNPIATTTQRIGDARERVHAFVRFLWHRFVDDKCFEAAGALSFTTVFALVPLTTAALGIISAFPDFSEWTAKLTNFIWVHFVPSAARAVQGYLAEFVENARQLTGAGIAALLVSVVLMLVSVEDTLNRIFRAPRRRSLHKRLVMYWTVLTFGPLLAAASFAASAYLIAWQAQLIGATQSPRAPGPLWSIAPNVLTWIMITVVFRLVPNVRVRLRYAAMGAALSTALFLIAKRFFGAYLANAPNYQQVFGALAAVPIFLIWIYVWWSVLLLGASLTASLSAFRYRPASAAVTAGQEFFVLIRMLLMARRSIEHGQALSFAQWLAAEPGLSEDQAARLAAIAAASGMLRVGGNDELLPLHTGARTLAALFERGGFRWPDALELAVLQARSGPDEVPLLDLLRKGREAQAAALGGTLDTLLPARETSAPVAP